MWRIHYYTAPDSWLQVCHMQSFVYVTAIEKCCSGGTIKLEHTTVNGLTFDQPVGVAGLGVNWVASKCFGEKKKN